MKKKKYALVLSGGGFKGAFQIGALEYIKENWKSITGEEGAMKFDIVSGVSVGSLNGALLAQNKFEQLKDLWKAVETNGAKEIFESNYIDSAGKIKIKFDELKKDLLPHFKVGLPLILRAFVNLIRRIFNRNAPTFIQTILQEATKEFHKTFPTFLSLATNKALAARLNDFINLADFPPTTSFLCGFVSITDGNYYSCTQHDFESEQDLRNGILASTAMPIIWPPNKEIRIKKAPFRIINAVDGGIRNVSPLGDVFDVMHDEGDDTEYHLIIINCASGRITDLKNEPLDIAHIALRSLTEITLAEIFENDIREFLTINKLVGQAGDRGVPLTLNKNGEARILKKFKHYLVQPKEFELGDTLDTTSEILKMRRILGYQRAKEETGKGNWSIN